MKKDRLIYYLYVLVLIGCSPAADQSEKKEYSEEASKKPHNNKEIVCFIYHRFGDSRYPSTNTPIEDFESHLKYLVSENFEVISLGKALDYLQNGSETKKVAVITIDDGFRSFKENGWPLLKKYNLPATLFINTETIGHSDYMDWKMVNEVAKNGIEIGNHTHSHAYFLNLPPETRYDAFKSEVIQCQELIEKHTGIKPEVFAYPYGEWDDRMRSIIKELGFKGAVAQHSGVTHSATDLLTMPRFPMSTNYSEVSKFKMKANMHPLKITKKSPDDYILTKISQPVLTLEIDGRELRTDELQCFIQGASCELKMDALANGRFTLEIKPATAITSRRTLFTITAPGTQGWYWFSQLWINPSVED